MPDDPTQFIDLPPFDDGQNSGPSRRIAYAVDPGIVTDARPAIVWLTGLKSTMRSTKAAALADWAHTTGRHVVRLDYSGHGQSSGRFEDGRVGAWREEAQTVMAKTIPTAAPRILIGSSMGAHIALLALQDAMAAQSTAIKGLILIAPAWDATQRLMWDRFSPEIRAQIAQTGVYFRPSSYGDGPYALTLGLIREGARHLIGDTPFTSPCPVHILHGAQDLDVPLAHGQALKAHLTSSQVTLEIIPDGDHRLSRPQDIARLIAVLAGPPFG